MLHEQNKNENKIKNSMDFNAVTRVFTLGRRGSVERCSGFFSALTSRHFKTDKKSREKFSGFCKTGFLSRENKAALVRHC
jgi:hypothetical protein